MSDLPEVVRVQFQGADARAAADIIVAGFFALWMVDELYTPEYLEHYRKQIRALKGDVTPAAAMRVLQCVSRAHPQAQRLLSAIEDMKGLPW